MSMSSQRRIVNYYVVDWEIACSDGTGMFIAQYMDEQGIPRFVQPTVMQGLGLTLTWDWHVPIPESNLVAGFVPYLCVCGHMKRDHKDEFGGACTVSIDGPIDCSCAGFEWERIKNADA